MLDATCWWVPVCTLCNSEVISISIYTTRLNCASLNAPLSIHFTWIHLSVVFSSIWTLGFILCAPGHLDASKVLLYSVDMIQVVVILEAFMVKHAGSWLLDGSITSIHNLVPPCACLSSQPHLFFKPVNKPLTKWKTVPEEFNTVFCS